MRAPVSHVLFLIAFALAGCGGSSEKVVPVTGTVTRKGKPVAGLTVTFVPQGGKNGTPSSAVSDEDGKYTLAIATTGAPGAVVGPHRVWVAVPLASKGDDEDAKKRTARARLATELADVLRKYGRPEDSPLQFEVKNVPAQAIDIPLD